MRITEIRKVKKGFSIHVDGCYDCVLHEEIFAAARLSCGQEIDEGRLEELRRLSAEKRARERALRLLGARSYSRQGLCEKLLEVCEYEEIAAAAAERMEELGLLDDRDYARRLAADCKNRKGFAPARIAAELTRKGIAREIIEETLADMEEDPRPAIARIALRKYGRHLGDEKGVRKAFAGLMRLGYRSGDIREVLGNLAEDLEYYDGYEED